MTVWREAVSRHTATRDRESAEGRQSSEWPGLPVFPTSPSSTPPASKDGVLGIGANTVLCERDMKASLASCHYPLEGQGTHK